MRKILLLSVLVLAASTVMFAAPPEVCRVQGGNVRTIWGAGFTPGQTEVWGSSLPYDKAKVIAAIGARSYKGRNLAPAQPPQGSGKIGVIDNDPRGLVLAIDAEGHYGGDSYFDSFSGPDVIWVKNSDGYSRPWLVTAPQPWFIYPEKANPGQRIRIFGRNVGDPGMETNSSYAMDERTKLMVAIKPKSGGEPIFLSGLQGGRQYQHGATVYEVSALLPADLKPGDYEVYEHNGRCGEAGWGGPLDITVQPEPKPVTKVLNVKDFGAKGDSMTDDTHAIKSALAKTAQSGPAIIYFPPGRYAISQTLVLQPGVTLQGAGMNNSIITVLPKKPLQLGTTLSAVKMKTDWLDSRIAKTKTAPLLMMVSNNELLDMGFEDGPGVQQIAYVGHDDCRIERCRIQSRNTPNSDASESVVVEWGSYGFVMKDCEVEATGGCLNMRHGPHEQAYVGGNKFHATRQGLPSANLGVRALNRCIIENNTSNDAQRNFCGSTGRASMYHTILQGNSWFNNIARRHNGGENMYESGTSLWHGKVLRATANTMTVSGTPFAATQAQIDAYPWRSANETFVLVIDGRGLGQYRKVTSYTADTLTLDRPWDVIPDSSTYITVGRSAVETLWVDNTEEHTAGWTAWWGNCWGNVIDGQILRDGEGIYLWAFQSDSPTPVAFNDVIGSELIGRAQIRFIGPLVFGNTVRSSEIIDFRYKPSFHGSMPWMHDFDPNKRFAIDLSDSKHTMTTLPATAPLKDWNIISNVNIYDGPLGIHIAPDAQHNILARNTINVDGEKVVDESRK